MAKKKNLTQYQQARREFVQKRTAARGGEVTAEQKQKFRQRFDVLASDVQGRGKLARNLRPGATQEERKNFRRMLATEIPARRNLGTGGGGTGGTSSTSSSKPPVTSYTADQIATMRKAAQTYGPQLSMAGTGKAPQPAPSVVAPKASTKKPGVLDTLRSAIEQTIPGASMVSQSRREFDKGNRLGGLGRLLGGTALITATLLSGGKAPKGALPSGPLKAPKPPLPRTGGPVRPTAPGPRGSGPIRPMAPSRGPKALGPGPKPVAPSPATATTPKANLPKATTPKANLPKAKTPKPKTPKPKTPKPAAPKPKAEAPKPAAVEPKTMPKKADTPAPTPKRMPKKAETPAPTPKQMPKRSAKEAEDVAYSLNQARIKYPNATESDLGFIKTLNAAQDIIQKQGPNWQKWKTWIENPERMKQIRNLRGK